MNKQDNRAIYTKTTNFEAKNDIFELVSETQFFDMLNFKHKSIPVRIPDTILFGKSSKCLVF